jgi:hypothetical protein
MITGRNQAHDFVDVRSGTDAVVDFGAGTQAECSARPRKLRPNSLLRRKGHQHLLSSGTFRFDKGHIRPLDCYNRPVDHITQQGRCSGVTANSHIHQCDIWQNHSVVEKARGIHFRVDRVLIHLLYSPWRLFARTNSRARAAQLGHDTGRSPPCASNARKARDRYSPAKQVITAYRQAPTERTCEPMSLD